MPGAKDCISVSENGVRDLKQKRLLSDNVDKLYDKFLLSNPGIKISLSKFTKLRPKECIVVGKSGTHNVCVCKTHENVRLKMFGLKQNLKHKGVSFEISFEDCLKEIVCLNSVPDCFFLKCNECLGTEEMSKKFKAILEDNDVTEINFTQWMSTDR